MSSLVRFSEAGFLEKLGLGGREVEQAVTGLTGVDYADAYLQLSETSLVAFEEEAVKGVKFDRQQGVGVRVLAGVKTGYAFSDEVTPEQLQIAASAARYIAENKGGGSVSLQAKAGLAHDLYSLVEMPSEVDFGARVHLLALIDQECRAYDSRIESVQLSLVAEDTEVLIVSRDGWMVGDRRPLIRLRVVCVAREGDRRELGFSGGGGRVEFSWFRGQERWKKYAREAARMAVTNLSAIEAPAGSMTVVLGPGWPGILLHEAVGHGLEGDFNRKGTSAFSNKIGQMVASELCTVVDDGTIPNRRGSLNIDDEGVPTRRNVLIENGRLKGYLQDRLNAKLMNMPLTGNGRRESYQFAPMPRMTNTFMLPGASNPGDIIRSVNRGLCATAFGGGQVDITNGKFVFSAAEAYLIEDGKITRPVKGATFIGDGPTVLQKITMVGNDLALDEGIGTCGKDGQAVPVGVGIPTIRIEDMTVGGTQVSDKGGVR